MLVTTTTRMFRPDPAPGMTVLVEPDFGRRVEALRDRWQGAGIVALFSAFEAAETKVAGCLPAEVDALRAAAVVDTILVEADGARHRLLKAPEAHEPCVPDSSDVVVALTGGLALGARARRIRLASSSFSAIACFSQPWASVSPARRTPSSRPSRAMAFLAIWRLASS